MPKTLSKGSSRPQVRRLLRDSYYGAGILAVEAKVTTAAEVGEAFQLLERLKPDVLVSDIGMPVEDGYARPHPSAKSRFPDACT